MFKLIKSGKVYSPEYLGEMDILISDDKICKIAKKINVDSSDIEVEIIDAKGTIITPGFIDQHVHLIGGGGEAGYHSRTPEITLSAIVSSGITTVVGLLGTDGTTRHLESLLAKAYALDYEGITTFICSGSYELPTQTLTGSVRKDLILIDKVIGVKIALSDHRSSQPTKEELKRLVEDVRVAGMISNRFGVVVMHMGDGKEGLDTIFEIVDEIGIPPRHFLPSHVNRNQDIFNQAMTFAKLGGFIDITSGLNSTNLREDTLKPSKAVTTCLENDVAIDNITMSSDGNGSVLTYNSDGTVKGLGVSCLSSLHREFVDMVKLEGIEIADALKVITSNVAKLLAIYPRKGCLQAGSDADLLILNEDLCIDTVVSKGVTMVQGNIVLVKGTFE